MVRAALTFPTVGNPIFFGNDEPNSCETKANRIENDYANQLWVAGSTESKIISWQESSVSDCLDYPVGFVTKYTSSSSRTTRIFPGYPTDKFVQVKQMAFPWTYAGDSKANQYITVWTEFESYDYVIILRTSNMYVYRANILKEKEAVNYEGNFVSYLRSSSYTGSSVDQVGYVWGIHSSSHTNKFTLAQQYADWVNLYIYRNSTIDSKFGVTAVNFWKERVYLAGSHTYTGTNDFSPVWGYGLPWEYQTYYLRKMEHASFLRNRFVDKILPTRKLSSTNYNFVFYLARKRQQSTSAALDLTAQFSLIHCYDHQGGTFPDGNECLLRNMDFFQMTWFFTLDDIFTVDNGSGGFDIGFIAYGTGDGNKYPNRIYDSGEVVYIKVKNFHELEMNNGTLQQKLDKPLLQDFVRINGQCIFAPITNMQVMDPFQDKIVFACTTKEYPGGTSLIGSGTKFAVVIQQLDMTSVGTALYNQNMTAQANPASVFSADDYFQNITTTMEFNRAVIYTNAYCHYVYLNSHYRFTTNQIINVKQQAGNRTQIRLGYWRMGIGAGSTVCMTTVTLIEYESMGAVPTHYHELYSPMNYSHNGEITWTRASNLDLSVDISNVFTFRFYVMSRNQMQQDVSKRYFEINVLECGSNSCSISSPVATKEITLTSTSFNSAYQYPRFDAFTAVENSAGCGFSHYSLTYTDTSGVMYHGIDPIDQTSVSAYNYIQTQTQYDSVYRATMTGYCTNPAINDSVNVTITVLGPCSSVTATLQAGVSLGPLKYYKDSGDRTHNLTDIFIQKITTSVGICYVERDAMYLPSVAGSDFENTSTFSGVTISGDITGFDHILTVSPTAELYHDIVIRARPRTNQVWVDLPLEVTICHINSISTAANQLRIKKYNPGDPASLAESDRYFIEDLATLESYFTITPIQDVNTPAMCKEYTMKLSQTDHVDNTYSLTNWVLDTNPYKLKLDLTQIKEDTMRLWFKVTDSENNIISGRVRYDFEVCSENSYVINDSAFNITRVYYQNQQNDATLQTQIYPHSLVENQITDNCSKCTHKVKVVNADNTDYTPTDVLYDYSDSKLKIKTNAVMKKRDLKLAVYPDVAEPQCSFIKTVYIPVDLTVCGGEVVSLVNSSKHYQEIEINDGDNTQILAPELMAQFVNNDQICVIEKLELSKNPTGASDVTGAPWESYITLDVNNDLNIAFKNNVLQNTTVVFYIYAETIGKQRVAKEFEYFLYIKNKPPTMTPPSFPNLVNSVLHEYQLRQIIEHWEFVSQTAEDEEGNPIFIELQGNLPCNCLIFTQHTANSFKLNINNYQIGPADDGHHSFPIVLFDHFAKTNTTYTLNLHINYTVYDNPAPFFQEPVPDFILTINEVNKIFGGIKYTEFTSMAVDPDYNPYDVIDANFFFIDPWACDCIELKLLANESVRIEIYKPKLMKEDDEGPHRINIILFDNETLHQTDNIFTIDVQFVTIAPIQTEQEEESELEPMAAEPVVEEVATEEVVEEEPEEAAEEDEEEGEKAPAVAAPTIGPIGNPFALSPELVNKQFSTFTPPKMPKQKEKVFKPLKLKLERISRNGLCVIKPNQPIYRPAFFDPEPPEGSDTNEASTQHGRKLMGYNEIDVGRDLIDFTFILNSEEESEKIQYSLELKKWGEEEIEVQINFKDPTIISQGLSLDQVLCRVKKRHLFVSKESGEILQSDSKYFANTLPLQLPQGVNEDELQATAETTSTSMKAMVFIQIIIQIFLKGSLNELWTLFFTLQIICYLEIYDTAIPPNADIYVAEFKKIIEFDMLNPEGIIRIFDPEFSIKAIMTPKTASVTDAAPKSMMDDLKMFVFALILALVVITGLCCLSRIERFKGFVIKTLVGFKKKFFFNGLLRSLTIAYIQSCISSGAQIRMFLNSETNQEVGSIISGWVIGTITFVLPIFFIYFLHEKQSKLHEEEFQEKYLNLYAGVTLKRGFSPLLYTPVFLIRRIIFVALPTFFFNFPFLQLQLLIFLTSIYVGFYMDIRPHVDRRRLKLEVFNELMIMLINYHMATFSKFNLDVYSGFIMGYSHVAIILLIVLVNIGSLIHKILDSYHKKKASKLYQENITKFYEFVAQQKYLDKQFNEMTELDRKIDEAERLAEEERIRKEQEKKQQKINEKLAQKAERKQIKYQLKVEARMKEREERRLLQETKQRELEQNAQDKKHKIELVKKNELVKKMETINLKDLPDRKKTVKMTLDVIEEESKFENTHDDLSPSPRFEASHNHQSSFDIQNPQNKSKKKSQIRPNQGSKQLTQMSGIDFQSRVLDKIGSKEIHLSDL